ncbi:kinase-like domain-containing protein [Paraphysoderma sedebokerense]|nr:kinase-like domain-containing protein [Paraphysoderma sedebokerense]
MNPLPPTPSPKPLSVSPYHQPSSKREFKGCGKLEDYQLEDEIGSGTFGKVCKGTQKATGKAVALKRFIMNDEKEGMPITALREIRLLKGLQHVNIVNLIDMVVAAIYMVFPYMSHDLEGLIQNPKAKFTREQVKAFSRQLLEGIFYLHSNNIIHRDIKCANILIDKDGYLKIADFGLAREFNAYRTRPMTPTVVTRWYRAPELLLEAERYDTKLDMWSVGCVIGEMMYGRPLFQANSEIEQLEVVFRECGDPTNETWPGWLELKNAKLVKLTNQKRRLKHYLSKGFSARLLPDWGAIDHLYIDLVDKLLVCNPVDRLSAHDALDHKWFYARPGTYLPVD